jgi:signal transduction histidine kinase
MDERAGDQKLPEDAEHAPSHGERLRIHAAFLEGSDREQRRIGRDLHDTLLQSLVAASMSLRGVAKRLEVVRPDEAAILLELADVLRRELESARTLSRSLHPVTLVEQGLAAALEQLASATSARIPCRFVSSGLGGSDAATSVHLYRIAQEAIANAVQHGRASRIEISLRSTRDALTLEVSDDGMGFSSELPVNGMGLTVMKYRAEAMGAELAIGSSPGKGTVVRCTRRRKADAARRKR